ncbi:MAG: precorrin-3B C(17)-methyltransferase [Firmicutes bacterium]|nr:precorrin-3B C(17)-methyltransferase [Bacillota bacterium]
MGRIYILGMGPGSYEKMTLEAKNALEEADIIIGYTLYTELLKKFFPEKIFAETPMRKETERCELAFAEAEKGKTVTLVCSGDAGIYGLSGLMHTLAKKYPDTELINIAGVSAVISGAALLGAPLMHDFAVISLSDLLTPWEKIEKRILLAAEADFVICFYNPGSKKRSGHLKKACELILKVRPKETVCAIARNISRENECSQILSLGELCERKADMFDTIFIGNSETFESMGKMITPRGYKNEQ